MKRLNFILMVFVMAFFLGSCDQEQCEDHEFDDEEMEKHAIEEGIDVENDEIAIDFEELEDKMEEIMYESDDSDEEAIKDVAVIKSQGAKKVDVTLEIGAGKLILSGGSSELLTGGFIYSNAKWKPEIKYKVKNKNGFLYIEQPESKDFHINDDDRYIWNLKFNNKIPLHFDIELGAGVSEIALSDLNLKHFHMVTGVGKTEVDLRGKWKQSTDIYLDGGIGLTQVYLPDNVGVKLEVTKGIGSAEIKNLKKKKSSVYVNEAYETSDIIVKIYLKTGIGKIEVE